MRGSVRPDRVQIVWQNVVLAITLAGLTVAACLLLARNTSGPVRLLLIAAVLAVGVVLIVRALRTGVYATAAGLTVRHLLRTRTHPWQAITGVAPYEDLSTHGGRYYAPMIVRRDGTPARLWMLATVSRTSAMRMLDRVQRLGAVRPAR